MEGGTARKDGWIRGKDEEEETEEGSKQKWREVDGAEGRVEGRSGKKNGGR